MEEKWMKERGWRELDSSELQLYGGGNGTFAKIMEKVRNLIDTSMDYLPNLLKGLKDGFLGTDSLMK